MVSKLNLPILKIIFLESKTKENSFLFDTGAEISIININSLKDNITLINEKTDIMGIGGVVIKTLGLCYLTFKFKDDYIKHAFHVLPENYPFSSDGILGFDFMESHKILIDCGKHIISLGNKELTTELKNNTIIEENLTQEKIMEDIKEIKIKQKDIKTEKLKKYSLKARHINLIKVQVNSNEDGIISKINLPKDLYMANQLIMKLLYQ